MSDVQLYRSRLADLPGSSAPLQDHFAFARETTPADVDAGRAGAAGDFLVLRDEHGVVQWWTRAAFDRLYELADDERASANVQTSADLAAELLGDGAPIDGPDADDDAPAPGPLVSHFMASADAEDAANRGDVAGVVAALDVIDRNMAGIIEVQTNQQSILSRVVADVAQLQNALTALDVDVWNRANSDVEQHQDHSERAADHGRRLDGHDRRLNDVEKLAGALDAAVRNLDTRTESLA